MSRVSGDAPLSWSCWSRRVCVPSTLTHRPPVAKELIALLRARTVPELLRHSRSSSAFSPPPTRPPPESALETVVLQTPPRFGGFLFAVSGNWDVHTDNPSGGTVGSAVTSRVLLSRGDGHLCKITRVAMVTDGKQGYGLTRASIA